MMPDLEDPIIAAKGMLKGSGILKVCLKEKKKEKEKENRKGHTR